MKLDKYLLLSWKRVLIIPAWILSVVLHGVIYYLFYEHYSRMGGDEPVFFILAVIVIPIYFIISLLYTVMRLVRSRAG